ncbi:ABC transporter permease [Halomonas salipaludis]|uniref:ABC transporter permease n=1 Tax=Halomonas salipaludis TaxID=2032625 RepID=A0A2A2EUM5_9GAMM|nr:ABC transporter permease [Halomonas salipaludis]PAU76057.1 ABC transporter permease [Halomonas salipaludis]
MTEYVGSRLWAALSILGFFLFWELAVHLLEIPAYLLPPVSGIVGQVYSDLANLLGAAGVTLFQAVAGFSIGALVGLTLAIALTFMKSIRQSLLSIVVAINTVPMIAYAPLVILWFGVGMQSKVIIVSCEVGFTVLLGTLGGLNQTDQRSIDLLRSFGAGPLTIMTRLRLPTALPAIMTALRLSTVRSIIATIVVEMLGAYQGLGWTIFQSVVMSDFLTVWAAIFLASIMSLLFFGLISWLERRLVFWR